jgi:hypothetical protein
MRELKLPNNDNKYIDTGFIKITEEMVKKNCLSMIFGKESLESQLDDYREVLTQNGSSNLNRFYQPYKRQRLYEAHYKSKRSAIMSPTDFSQSPTTTSESATDEPLIQEALRPIDDFQLAPANDLSPNTCFKPKLNSATALQVKNASQLTI